MSSMRISCGIAGVVAASLWSWGCGQRELAEKNAVASTLVAATNPAAVASDPPTAGTWFPVTREFLRQYVPAVGSFRARQITKIGPRVAGRVEAVEVREGDLVRKGQVLVRLDARFFEIAEQQARASLDAAKGALASAQAELAEKRREMERQLEVFRRNAGSPKERDDAISAFERAQGTVSEKQGRLAEAEQRLAYAVEERKETLILAPYDGVITERLVDPGEPVSATPVTHLLEIQEVGVLYLEFSLAQELLKNVRAGTRVEWRVEGVAGDPDQGEVAVVFPAIDELTRSFRCRVIVDNPALKYRPGMLAAVRVVVQEIADALTVPRKALRPAASGYEITVLSGGQPTVRRVEVGLLTEDRAEIREGLGDGDRVMLEAAGS